MLVRPTLCQMCQPSSPVTSLLCSKTLVDVVKVGSKAVSGGEAQDCMHTFIFVSCSQNHFSVSVHSAFSL